MIRILFVLFALVIGAVVAYGDPQRIASASSIVSDFVRDPAAASSRAVEIPRGNGGEFALRAQINGVATPMVIDTGATSVVLTYETAKAAGLPLELLSYDVEVETGADRPARPDAFQFARYEFS
jgi:aspartyl protease family protein